jgi:hypothetical protein
MYAEYRISIDRTFNKNRDSTFHLLITETVKKFLYIECKKLTQEYDQLSIENMQSNTGVGNFSSRRAGYGEILGGPDY